MLDTFMEGMMKTVVKYAPVAVAHPKNEEARANLMWTSSWAINDFVSACQRCTWSCHPMEHQLSAYYDITHGLGLAILTPRWMRYVLDETTAERFRNFAVSVFGVDPTLPNMEAAKTGIEAVEKFLFEDLKLTKTLTELGIDKTHFAEMADKACHAKGGRVLKGYKHLTPKDVEAIYEMCL